MDLAGQVAVVTGGSRGIGRATALALGRAGAAVVVGYRERIDAAQQVVAEIIAGGGRAISLCADVTDPSQCEALVTAALQSFGRLDILVNNAGTSLDRLLTDTAIDEWEAQMAVHLRGMYCCTRAALKPMSTQKYGRIINVSSIWGISGAANEVAYSTAKAGQIGFTKALAQEVAAWGITVNALAPGAVNTDMLADFIGNERTEWMSQTPVGRLGTPEEIAAVICFLAGPGAGFITGQVWSPNGGVLM
jgi:3-oxoacyl-[acyl-carrier protein] reductase